MSTGASGDWRRVSEILESMTTTYGFSFPVAGNVSVQLPSTTSETSRESLDAMMARVFEAQWEWVLSALEPLVGPMETQAHELVRDRTWNEEKIHARREQLACRS
jgi:hypothetical protein